MKFSGISIFLSIAMLAMTAGSGRTAPQEEVAPRAAAAAAVARDYRLRPGDQIAVSISPQKEYDVDAIVLPDGSAFLRNIGTIRAGGKKLSEIEADITRLLEGELVNYKVTVTLLRLAPEPPPPPKPRRFITVAGAVASPGQIEYEDGLNIRRALVLAGGLVREADPRGIRVYPRPEGAKTAQAPPVRKADASPSELFPNDPRKDLIQPGGYIPVALPDSDRNGPAGAMPAPTPAGTGTRDTAPRTPAPSPTRPGTEPSNPAVKGVNATLEIWEGDAIEVHLRPVEKQPMIRLSGLVRTPGTLVLTEDMRLEDAFKEGGLPPLADPRRIRVYRQGKRVLWNGTTVTLVRETLPKPEGQEAAEEPKPAGDRKKTAVQDPGPWISLQDEILRPPHQKLRLQNGDEIYVPKVEDSVIVIGGVQQPGWRPLELVPDEKNPGQVRGQTIREFFLQNSRQINPGAQDLPGVFNPAIADLGRVEIIRGGRLLERVNLNEIKRMEKRDDNRVLETGDIIYVPPRRAPDRGPLYYLRELPYLGFLFGLF